MKILIRLPNWLGDLVMSSGFVNAVKAEYPEADIYVIVKEDYLEFFDFFPGITKVFGYSQKRYMDIMKFIDYTLMVSKDGPYDMYFCLPGSFSSAMMGYLCGSNVRIGYKGEFRSIFLSKAYKRPVGIHRVEEYIYLLREFKTRHEADFTVKLNAEFTGNPFGKIVNNSNKNVVLNINSFTSSRRIPYEKGALIADALVKKFNCNIILVGKSEEQFFTRRLVEHAEMKGNIIDYAGRTSLKELACLLRYSDVVVSADSGIAHLANSVGTGVVVLFGAGDEKNTSPYNKKGLCVLRAEGIKCAPCVSNMCMYRDNRCLNKINVDDIVRYLEIFFSG
jgi:lipopolysaccharide heptosyltransferase II